MKKLYKSRQAERRAKKWILFASVTGTILLNNACTERIDITLDSTYTRLVVYGEISNDSLRHTISLTKSADYFSNTAPPAVSGALVSVEYEDQQIEYRESPEEPGLYLPDSAFRGKPGTGYVLHISNVDINEDGSEEEYLAETRMPEPVPVDSVWVTPITTPYFEGHQVLLYAQDPPGEQFYNYRALRNGYPINDTLIEFVSQSDELFDGNYLYALPLMFLDNDDADEAVGHGDILTLEMWNIPEEYYYFISDARSEIFGSVPIFSGPPANVSTNISNGAMGFFVAYSVSRSSTMVLF